MTDFTTTLTNAMKKAARSILHDIAREGLLILRQTLDDNGFSKSKYLKNYEIYSHVLKDSVVFEILLDFESVVPDDAAAKQVMENKNKNLGETEQTYGIKTKIISSGMRDARRPARDARRPARDARRPARDARKGAAQRLFEHEVIMHSPRSARITREGKLSVTLQRTMRETENKINVPQDTFDGVMRDVTRRLGTLISNKFAPSLAKILQRYVQ